MENIEKVIEVLGEKIKSLESEIFVKNIQIEHLTKELERYQQPLKASGKECRPLKKEECETR